MSLMQTSPALSRPTWVIWSSHALIHLAGVCVIALLMAIPFWSQRTLSLAAQAREAGLTEALLSSQALIHLGLAACFWTMLVLGARWLRETQRERRERALSRRLVRARGSVILETLIVMPVFLLLLFGLAQFAVMNMASMLTTVAAFQATRTVWLWHGEGNDRDDTVRKATIQAATVVAPVIPGEYAGSTTSNAPEHSQNRGIFVASQFPWPVADSGYQGRTIGDRMADEIAGTTPPIDLVAGFDTSAFSHRTVRKLTVGYDSIDVSYDESAESITVTTVYHHLNVFPLVSSLFGDLYERAGREGYHVPITRKLSLQRQRSGPDRSKFPKVTSSNPVAPYLF
ncbi:TadE/TadG family type IV pilus assembly protein [Lujinxingia litoralis]|nr:TadE family protein [Lujinxingia litoralis]